jgi:c-di-GMP-binding flagellar brake protein YcgR
MPAARSECHDLDEILNVNRPVQVVFKTDRNKFVYKSTVADFDSGHIYITPITRNGRPAILRSGEKIELIYYGQDAMYEFATTVTGHRKENNVTLTIIEKPQRCGRVQRREFYRYALSAKAYFKRVEVEESDGKRRFRTKGPAQECFFDDISGGGLSFHSAEELVDDSYVLFEFELPIDGKKETKFREIVKIIRTKKINPLNRKGDFEYTYGSSFVTLDEEKQISIIKFIMHRQIEEHKNLRQKKK